MDLEDFAFLFTIHIYLYVCFMFIVYPWKLKKKRSPFLPRLLGVLPFYISYQAGQRSDKKVKKEKKLSFLMKNLVLISEFHLLICWVVSVRVAWASRIIFDGKVREWLSPIISSSIFLKRSTVWIQFLRSSSSLSQASLPLYISLWSGLS